MNKHDWQNIKEFFTWVFRDFTVWDYIFLGVILAWGAVLVLTLTLGWKVF